LPGAPFERFDFQRHAKINVDPLVRVRVPARKWYGCSSAIFGYAQFEILIVGRGRSGTPSGQEMMLKSGVKSLIGFPDDPGDIGNQMLCEFFKSLITHRKQSARSSGQQHHRESCNLTKIRRTWRQAGAFAFFPPWCR
jgi:hypothetical protein